jgi:eukaryotic-like serine/threonine-protein kinase
VKSEKHVHERYEQLALLGRGGGGAVYLVRDRTTGERIALKRLIHADTQSLLLLKQEFRSLAELHHPNLVKLYELGHDATSPFFTMEYLEGQELKKYFDPSSTGKVTAAANDNLDDDARFIARVLDAFLQLAHAVGALHRANVLHRDLKPGNVMVVEGRVVVLDFGIAIQVGMDAKTITLDRLMIGTPAYMAPEQVQSNQIGEANDWYSFGVMLYEALSGVLPIDGLPIEMLMRKTKEDPPPLAGLVPQLPSEVAELCMRLLSRSHTERPRGDEVTRVLSAHAPASQRSRSTLSPGETSISVEYTRNDPPTEPSLFGRNAELLELHSAFRDVQAGEFAAVHVAGESGSGKTSLVQHFTEEVERGGLGYGFAQPLVLRSRCYERETLPFKALDGAVDALANHLSRASELVLSHALPSDLGALTQLFPVFHRLPAIKQLSIRRAVKNASSSVRIRAEAALSELLRRVAGQRPIVLWIDDLQWGDADSVGILKQWLDKCAIAQLMLVLSYRSEEIATSPCLHALLDRSSVDAKVESTIRLRALEAEHVRALCEQRFELAQVPAEMRSELVSRIVQEAQGSPFLASQLVELVVAEPSRADEPLASLSLTELVRSRSLSLSGEARRLLNVISIAGRPIPLRLALSTANIEAGARTAIYELRHRNLIRSREVGDTRLLEVYHDRLREVVQCLLSPSERLELDRSLLSALQASGLGDSDWLHVLALGAGERNAALRYGLSAAERALDTLAFERAAELYECCLGLTDDPAADGGELWEKLALAYAYGGHGYKAATVYLKAARAVGSERSLRFERSAASHLVCSGRYEEGEALVRHVLARIGEDVPNTQPGLLAAVAWERARGVLRGHDFEPRPNTEIPFETYFRAELLGMLSMETAAYDPLRAALFQARCLRMALAVGEPESIARAFCAAATMECVSGSERGKRRADELLAKAEAIAKAGDNSLLRMNLASASAMCAFLTGRLEHAVELSYEAENLHRTSSLDSEYHHRFSIATARIAALLELGEYRRARSDLLVYLREAEATENINAQLLIALAQTYIQIVSDRTDLARARLTRQRSQLPRHGFGLLHVLHMAAVFRVGCASGDYDWAVDATREYWKTYQHSVIRMSAAISKFAFSDHARLLLCRAARDGNVRETARAVAGHIKYLARCNRGDSAAEALRLEARIAVMSGDRDRAKHLFERSASGFEAKGVHQEAARDRYARGCLIGGEQGHALMREALASLSELGVVAPSSNLQGYIPELLDRDASR